MSEEFTAPRDAYELSESERDEIFEQRIVPVRFGEVHRVEQPVAHFIGGAPGAGKSNLGQRLALSLAAGQDEGLVQSIVGDELRVFHPRYAELLDRDDEHAAYYTDLDSGAWVERAIGWSLSAASNVVLEGTLRRPELTRDTAQQYQAEGFGTELHVMVVHEFVSRLSILGRYLKAVEREGHGRYTVREAHDEAYERLPDSVAALAESGAFDRIAVCNREGEVVAEGRAGEAGVAGRLRLALEDERVASLASAGLLLEQIDRYEAGLQILGKRAALRDLTALRSDVLETSR